MADCGCGGTCGCGNKLTLDATQVLEFANFNDEPADAGMREDLAARLTDLEQALVALASHRLATFGDTPGVYYVSGNGRDTTSGDVYVESHRVTRDSSSDKFIPAAQAKALGLDPKSL